MGFKQSFFNLHKDIDGNILKPGDKVLWSEYVDGYYVSDRNARLCKTTVIDADASLIKLESKAGRSFKIHNSHKTLLKYDWT